MRRDRDPTFVSTTSATRLTMQLVFALNSPPPSWSEMVWPIMGRTHPECGNGMPLLKAGQSKRQRWPDHPSLPVSAVYFVLPATLELGVVDLLTRTTDEVEIFRFTCAGQYLHRL
jgi:hypothetical protein